MKSNKRYLLVALALLLATLLISGLALAAGETTATEPKVTSIKFSAASYSADLPNSSATLNFERGDAEDDPKAGIYHFTVVTEPADASLSNFKFVITSTDTTKATTSGSINAFSVHGKAVGSTELFIRVLDKTTGKLLYDSPKVTVTFKEVPVKEIIYNAAYGTPYELNLNSEGTFANDIVTILPADATYSSFASLTWSTTDTDILRLSTKGYYRALEVGDATVKVTSKGDNPVSAEFQVKVKTKPYTSVSFKPDSFSVDHTAGSYEGINNIWKYLVIKPGLGSDGKINAKKVTWSSSDPKIAFMDFDDWYYYDYSNSHGWYVAFGGNPGTATLTLTITNYDDSTVSTSIKVTVLKDAITSIKFIKDEYTLATDDYKYLLNELILKPDGVGYYYDGEYDLLWSSSDETVALVEEDGDLYTKKPGTATITVKCKHDETIKAETKITVTNKTISKVKMPATLELSYASSTPQSISFTYEPYDAYIEEVTWVSSDPTVIQIPKQDPGYTSGGTGSTSLYTQKAGTATVTVKVNDGTSVHEASCVVTVKRESASSLKLSKKKLTLYLHKSASDNEKIYTLKAYDKNKELGYEDVTWSSNKKYVVSVDRNGNLTVHSKGKATITATTKDGTGLTASCTVEVKKQNLKSITGNKKITMRVSEMTTLKGLQSNGLISFSPTLDKVYDDDLTFKSSNRNVVSVNKKTGTMVANKVGEAKITVTSKANKKVTFTFKVKVIEAVE